MGKPDILIFTPTEEESRRLTDGLAGAEFENFRPCVLAVGPGRNRARAAVENVVAPLLTGREKPLLLIGAGRCRPLAGGLEPGETAVSASVFLQEGDVGRLESSTPLVQAIVARLAVKGFRPGRILDESSGGGDARAEPGCLASDAESAALALAASSFSPEPAWLNIRTADDGLSPDDHLETLTLKILVALSTIDRTPPPSSCSGCRNPCNIFK